MKKDTTPVFGNAPRYRKLVTIQQESEFWKSVDTTHTCPSDELPEWFAPLQGIIEDQGFRGMVITLGSSDGTGGQVDYHITAERDSKS